MPVSATYRVQLHAGFTFADVARLAPYLKSLGITHVYCSPYSRARRGSTHGYDVVDHAAYNDELGGPDGFETMVAALKREGLGHIVDIVPNHMARSYLNRWWWDVLKRGRSSRFADRFDIEWSLADDKVMLGVLGDELEHVIDRKEIDRADLDGEPVLRYFDQVFPLAPGSEDIDDLVAQLDAQNYVLAEWRFAGRNLNYRRFFEVDELVAVRVESEGAFEDMHALVLDTLQSGRLQGLRIDHIDGLRDPGGYLRRLRGEIGDAYLVVEKILERDERLPESWPVDGTTGYDFLNLVGGIFIDTGAVEQLTEIYRRFTGIEDHPEELAGEKKMLAMRFLLPADISRLTDRLVTIFQRRGWESDVDVLRTALAEVTAALGVYRTYATPDGGISREDRRRLRSAISSARRKSLIEGDIFERVGSILLLEDGESDALDFLLAWQQVTGSVMAKGIEDTFFFTFNRFAAANEVGGDPIRLGVTTQRFHSEAMRAALEAPRSMLATSTHDTKRSEDVRARLALLSEIPDRWEEAVRHWSELASGYRIDGRPDRNAEYLMWQTLFGAWPIDPDRMSAFMLKAAREAKAFTSWHAPDPTYEEALESFVRAALTDDEILAAVGSFAEPLIVPGRVNSLSQLLIKLTYPGIPDIYRGCEIWDLSLVDPDNRRPVDYDALGHVLDRAHRCEAAALWADPDDGAPKMFVLARTLALRSSVPHAFGPGASYEALNLEGEATECAIGYVRGNRVAVVVPRCTLSGPPGATSVRLPDGNWTDVLTERTLDTHSPTVRDLLSGFPVALLVRE